jgi:hypothetical protein
VRKELTVQEGDTASTPAPALSLSLVPPL